jgi:hypothetical protein
VRRATVHCARPPIGGPRRAQASTVESLSCCQDARPSCCRHWRRVRRSEVQRRWRRRTAFRCMPGWRRSGNSPAKASHLFSETVASLPLKRCISPPKCHLRAFKFNVLRDPPVFSPVVPINPSSHEIPRRERKARPAPRDLEKDSQPAPGRAERLHSRSRIDSPL